MFSCNGGYTAVSVCTTKGLATAVHVTHLLTGVAGTTASQARASTEPVPARPARARNQCPPGPRENGTSARQARTSTEPVPAGPARALTSIAVLLIRELPDRRRFRGRAAVTMACPPAPQNVLPAVSQWVSLSPTGRQSPRAARSRQSVSDSLPGRRAAR